MESPLNTPGLNTEAFISVALKKVFCVRGAREIFFKNQILLSNILLKNAMVDCQIFPFLPSRNTESGSYSSFMWQRDVFIKKRLLLWKERRMTYRHFFFLDKSAQNQFCRVSIIHTCYHQLKWCNNIAWYYMYSTWIPMSMIRHCPITPVSLYFFDVRVTSEQVNRPVWGDSSTPNKGW